MKKAVFCAGICAVIAIGVLFQVSHLAEPITGDSSYFVGLIREMVGVRDYPDFDLPRGIGIWHPMLYQWALALIGRLFGPELFYFRIFGILIFAVNTILVGLIAAGVSKSPFFSATPLVACALFALNPLGVALAVHIDIDNSILTTALLLFLFCFISLQKSAPITRIILLSVCFALTLLCKLTTPLVLIAALFIYYLVIGEHKRAFIYSLGVLVIGAGIFALVWLAATRALGYPFWSVFARLMAVVVEKASASPGIMEQGRLILSVVYFITAPLLLFFLYVTVKVIRDRMKHVEEPVIFIAIAGALILVGYLFIGGLTYGVTKYQYPTVPILAVVCAVGIRRYAPSVDRKHLIIISGLLAVSLILCLLVGDPVLHLNYDYKYYLFSHRISAGIHDGFFPTIVRDALVYVLLPLVAFAALPFLGGRPRMVRGILVFLALNAVVVSAALYAVRVGADYAVLYAYGGRGGKQVLEMIHSDSRVLIGEGYICPPVIEKEIDFVRPIKDGGADGMIASIEQADPDYIVTGITLDTLDTLDRVYRDKAFLDYVGKRFRRVETGSYIVWIKNPDR